jgi:glycosyltransferase involved in cell wall biosynthesis
MELHLYGVTQSAGDDRYWNMLKGLAADDPRITFLPPVPHDEVIALLRRYHLLGVPSRWLETGPLVVLEAFAAGTPVIGSNLGGIADSVRDQRDGLLLAPEDVQAWANAFRRCAVDRHFLADLRKGVKPPRRVAEVAREMAQLYFQYITHCADPRIVSA